MPDRGNNLATASNRGNMPGYVKKVNNAFHRSSMLTLPNIDLIYTNRIPLGFSKLPPI